MIKNKLVFLGIIAAVSTQVTFASADADCSAEIQNPIVNDRLDCCLGGGTCRADGDPDRLARLFIDFDDVVGQYYIVVAPSNNVQVIHAYAFTEESLPFESCNVIWAPGGDPSTGRCGTDLVSASIYGNL